VSSLLKNGFLIHHTLHAYTMEELLKRVRQNGYAYVPEDLLEEVDFVTIVKEHWETYCFDDAYEGFQCVIYDPTQMSDETRKRREDNQGTCQWCDSTEFFPDSVLCKECAIEPEFDAYPCAECGQDAGPRNEFCSPCRRLHAK